MNKSVNSVLEGIRERLQPADKIEEEDKPKLGSGKRFQALVAKLKKRKDVKDPAALAAWIGRKKYGKKRFAALAKESINESSKSVDGLLVFEDVEDVIAFVEGLESLLGEGRIDEGYFRDFDHAAMGAFRRADPTEAPKLYGRVQKAAKALKAHLQTHVQKDTELRKEFLFAANALRAAIREAGGLSPKAAAGTVAVESAIKDPESDAIYPPKSMVRLLDHFLNSDEMKIGPSKVRMG
jgi:hypothetical protein